MRVYFEKPRSTVGWKGLINDPGLDGSGDVNTGLRLARALLLDVLRLGLPVGCEFLDPITPQYIADTVAWGAIGARTVESQVHRQLASGLSMPIGMKNRPDGSIGTAVDAIRAAGVPHVFPGIDFSGTPAIMHTRGNTDGHLVLRGGGGRPNYDAESVAGALDLLRAAGLPERLVIDASHANSGKDHRNQPRGRRGRGRPTGRRPARDHRRDAGVVPAARPAGSRPDPGAGVRPVGHRRLPRLGRHRRGARPPGLRRAGPPGHPAGDGVTAATRLVEHAGVGSLTEVSVCQVSPGLT